MSRRTPPPHAQPHAAGRGRLGLLAGVGVAGVVALVATGLLTSRGSEGSGGGGPLSTRALAADAGAPGVIHVHGLAVDPADRTLYAATHGGLFRVPEQGTAELVANRYQDTMGFTIAADGEFLGSGHPDLREDLPPLLGLISSDSRGETWRSESLLGDADFHALRAGSGVLFGYDSTGGRLMATTDRRTWETRVRQPLGDFAVDPEDAGRLVALGAQGVLASTDGGRSFARVAGAPALRAFAWTSTSLYGVDATGVLHASRDGGASWAARGDTGGEPEAMTVDGEDVYVAVRDRGILASANGGRTFTLRYRDASLRG